jgi:glycosyltransferase involved in cell wall biosynthesis
VYNDPIKRSDIVLSCRLVPEKNPLFAVRAIAGMDRPLPTLQVIGDGALHDELRSLADELQVPIVMHGAQYDPVKLAEVYSLAFAALSPGYVGLNLNQSVLSGIPLVYRLDAQHAPEVDYADETNSVGLYGTDIHVWAAALSDLRRGAYGPILPPSQLAAKSTDTLSLNAMVSGTLAAIRAAGARP